MPNNTNNFVTEAQPRNEIIQIPSARRISVDPGQIFAEPNAKQAQINYVAQGVGFNIKYAPLFIILAILAYGLAVKMGQDFWFGTVLFGALSVAGYWALGFMENVFEPTSGHVVRSWFGAKVIIADIESNERIQVEYQRTRQMELENERLAHEANIQRRDQVIEQMTQPQSTFNQLTTFDPEADVVHEPIPAAVLNRTYSMNIQQLEKPEFMNKTSGLNDTEKVLEILTDFTLDLYESLDTDDPLIKSDGIFNRTTKAPWSQRGVDKNENSVPAPIKRKIEDVIKQTTPRLFIYDGSSTVWRLNIKDYPDYDAACYAVEQTRVRKV